MYDWLSKDAVEHLIQKAYKERKRGRDACMF